MAELPGWDRARLATADPGDVAAARWQVYARVMAPQATHDYAAAIRDAEIAGMSAKARDRELERDRKVLVETLRGEQRQQPGWREQLLLDAVDDPDEDDA